MMRVVIESVVLCCVCRQVLSVYGDRQRFISTGDGGMEGFMVSRVPCGSVCDVGAVVGLLRQQAVFNQLYSSCFQQPRGFDNGDGDINGVAREGCNATVVFEVLDPTETAPRNLELRYFDAESMQLRCLTLHITVGGGVRPAMSGGAINDAR